MEFKKLPSKILHFSMTPKKIVTEKLLVKVDIIGQTELQLWEIVKHKA